MNLNDYQHLAMETAVYKQNKLMINVLYPMIGLVNEAGELIGRLKKILRGDKGIYGDTVDDTLLFLDVEERKEMALELGDCLWYVAMTAKDLGYTLEQVAQMNIDKLAKRKQTNALYGDGDHR